MRVSIVILLSFQTVFGFGPGHCNRIQKRSAPSTILALTVQGSSKDSSAFSGNLNVTLNKPLGFIIDEINENSPDGVLISELNPNGSAYLSTYKSQLIGSKILSINSINVERMMFDEIMELIASTESPINLIITPPLSSGSVQNNFEMASDTTSPIKMELTPGTSVKLTVSVAGESSSKIIDARVGDNLRQTLLDNGIELYRGWKKKLGNCGGGGQCTFCAVDVIDAAAYWEPRSEYEETKIGRKMGTNGRLACLNNIQGPADVVIPS